MVAACAVRTLARTETFMPMKPAAPDSTAPIAKPTATSHAEEVGREREDHDADDADRGVLALEIGLRAFAHGGRDLLHPRIAGIRFHHRMPSPRWRKRSKALRRAQSPIMLSLNLPQILMYPTPVAAGAAGA